MGIFLNRELSWLGFNYRVLQEAACPSVPLFERLRFLAIFSSNLDEFFRVRYPSVMAFSALRKKMQKKLVAEPAGKLAEQVQEEVNRQLDEFGNILVTGILPALNTNGIHLYYGEQTGEDHRQEVREIFLSRVLSFIQPLLLDGKRRFNAVNNQLYLAIALKKGEEDLLQHAIVNIPSNELPRFFVLSPIHDTAHVIFIDDIVRDNLQLIFPGFEILYAYSFKINRDAELDLDEEYSEDVLRKIERQLEKRNFGHPSRLLFETGMPRNLQLFLASMLDTRHEEMFAGGRYHNLRDLADFPTFGKQLSYAPMAPVQGTRFKNGDIFNLVDKNDILLHLPYQSYNPILSFFNQAAVDPAVTEIYIALYRVAARSHIANAMISAARNGKNVTVFLELKARFDEENNIRWSRKMKEAGVKLIYSIPGIKVHGKIALVRKKGTPVSYSLLSTGNFNETTARLYTDHVLLTCNRLIAEELLQLFQFLAKRKVPANKHELMFKKLMVSQFNMTDRFIELINGQIARRRAGEPALIRIKLNNLEEQEMISKLYEAGHAGVEIRMVVRGICCLIPSVAGLSENIVVKRIVDRYLEHSRIFIFGTDEQCEVIIGSADWMNRNLHRRIEVCVPVEDVECKKELVDYFNLQWCDGEQALMPASGLQQGSAATAGGFSNAQESIYNYIRENL